MIKFDKRPTLITSSWLVRRHSAVTRTVWHSNRVQTLLRYVNRLRQSRRRLQYSGCRRHSAMFAPGTVIRLRSKRSSCLSAREGAFECSKSTRSQSSTGILAKHGCDILKSKILTAYRAEIQFGAAEGGGRSSINRDRLSRRYLPLPRRCRKRKTVSPAQRRSVASQPGRESWRWASNGSRSPALPLVTGSDFCRGNSCVRTTL